MVLGWTPDGKILFRGQRGPLRGFIGEPYVVAPGGRPGRALPASRVGRHLLLARREEDRLHPHLPRLPRLEALPGRHGAGRLALRPRRRRRSSGSPTGRAPTRSRCGSATPSTSSPTATDWKLNLWRYDLADEGDDPRHELHRVRREVAARRLRDRSSSRTAASSTSSTRDRAGREGDGRPPRRPEARAPALGEGGRPDHRASPSPRAASGRSSPRAATSSRSRPRTATTRNVTRTERRPREERRLVARRQVDRRTSPTRPARRSSSSSRRTGRGRRWSSPPAPTTWHFPPVWSPDSKKLAFADRAMRLWVVDVARRRSPSSSTRRRSCEISQLRLLARRPVARLREDRSTTTSASSSSTRSRRRRRSQVTPSASSSGEPVFDPEGKYLYLLSDRDIAPTLGAFEASYTVNKDDPALRPPPRSATAPSPFAPKSDEAKLARAAARMRRRTRGRRATKKDEKKPEPVRSGSTSTVSQTALVAFPVPPGNYGGLTAAKGKLFWLSFPTRAADRGGRPAEGRAPDVRPREAEGDRPPSRTSSGYDLAPDGSRSSSRPTRRRGPSSSRRKG